MFSKTIYKQTLKSNYILWMIFTVILSVMSALIIAVYDPQTISSMMGMLSELPIADMMGDKLGSMTSLLGMLGNSFYGMIAVILPLIYIIITANSLVASQVDRGSMAYTLSTPIKRGKVIATQALYLITALVAMVLVVTVVGLSTVQLAHGGIFSKAYTDDVIAAADVLDIDKQDVEDDLNLILENENAIKEGAEIRGIEEDVYIAYINLRVSDNAYQAAADVLNMDVSAVSADLSLITGNEEALEAAAKVMGIEKETYRLTLEATIAQESDAELVEELQNKLVSGLTAAAEVLNMELADLSADMSILKTDQSAMDAAVTESGIPETMYISFINQQLANDELTLDAGVDFNVKDYFMLNFGLFLLLFAISSISFAASCIFNLSKYSLTFGAGIPIAFFLFQILSQTSDSLEKFKYFSLNTLYSPADITGGGSYWIQFTVLAALGVVLYTVGMRWFKKKDLPL